MSHIIQPAFELAFFVPEIKWPDMVYIVVKSPEKLAFTVCRIWPPMGWGGGRAPMIYTRPQELNEELWWGGTNWLIYKALTLSGYIESPQIFPLNSRG